MMIDSSCRRHDGRDVLVAAEGGQSTRGQPDRDTESIVGVDLATDTLEEGSCPVREARGVRHTLQFAVLLHGTLECVEDTTLVGVVGWPSNVRGVNPLIR